MTIDDIKAAIAACYTVTGKYAKSSAMSEQERTVRIESDGSISLLKKDGRVGADNVLYKGGNTLHVVSVGAFLIDPLPNLKAPDTYEYVVYAEGKDGPSVKHAGFNDAVEEATRIAQKLKTVRVYVLRIDAVVECEHTPVVMKC